MLGKGQEGILIGTMRHLAAATTYCFSHVVLSDKKETPTLSLPLTLTAVLTQTWLLNILY